MPKNGSNALKRAVRARMAETGENYATALSHIQEQRAAEAMGECAHCGNRAELAADGTCSDRCRLLHAQEAPAPDGPLEGW